MSTKNKFPLSKKSFSHFVQDDFFALHCAGGELKPSSVEFYRNISKRSIQYFGDIPIGEISSLDIEKFLATLRTEKQSNGKKLSPSTIRHNFKFLQTVFGFAERHELILKNPTKRVIPPKVVKKPVEFLAKEEAQEFLDILRTAPLRWQALFTLLITTGLRRGEAIALQWVDVNFRP